MTFCSKWNPCCLVREYITWLYFRVSHQLAQWLIDSKIIEHIFGPNLHVEVCIYLSLSFKPKRNELFTNNWKHFSCQTFLFTHLSSSLTGQKFMQLRKTWDFRAKKGCKIAQMLILYDWLRYLTYSDTKHSHYILYVNFNVFTFKF